MLHTKWRLCGAHVYGASKLPFNHLLSSLRQSALLLDPDNGDIRLGEVGALYQGGKFEAALRIAQIVNPPKAQAAQARGNFKAPNVGA